MTAKEYLSQTFKLKRLIAAKKARLQYLRGMRDVLGGGLSQVKVQSTSPKDPMGDAAAALMDAERECAAAILRLLKLQSEIEAAIESVARADLRVILYERYINLKRWEDVAADCGWGWDTVHRKHRAALAQVERSRKNRIESYTNSVI